MSNFSNGDLNIPDGYIEEVIESQLCYEDLDEDSELWLLRVPCDIPLSLLDRKKVYLGRNSGNVNLTDIKTENDKILECCAENCEIPNMCVVLPERSNSELQVVRKVFKGAILISEGLSLTDNTEVKTENSEDFPSVVTQDTVISPHISKQKKKKRNSHDSVLNYEMEAADNRHLLNRKHKKSSKRSEIYEESSERSEIKTEPEIVDSDEFPTCRSQK